TRERTHVIASTSRFYAMDEKIAMGDGRFDQEKLTRVIAEHARDALLVDMDAMAKQSGSIINAVMLGAIAGSGRLPLAAEQFEVAIRDDGKAVDANLRGFRVGYEAARAKAAPAPAPASKKHAPDTLEALEQDVAHTTPAAAQDIVREGVRRLVPYQSVAYARLYLDRLAPIAEADEQADLNGKLLREVARHLAVRMSYEDIVRVAQAKIAPERMKRIAFEELTQLLPPALARPILRYAERKGWLGRVYFGMKIDTTSISVRILLLPAA